MKQMKNLFDKRSDRWLKIYRIITIVLFWLFVGAGFIGGFKLFINRPYWVWSWDESVLGAFFDRLLGFSAIFLAGCLAAFANLLGNMLIIQLLNNIQIIRQKIEETK